MRLRLAAVLYSLALLATAPAAALEPYLVKDIDPIPQNISSNPREFVSLDNGIALYVADVDLFEREIWRSDGTAAGTYQLTDTCPHRFCPQPTIGVAHAGDRSFYLAEPEESQNGALELWITGGSPVDTFNLGGPFFFNRYVTPVWVASRRLLFFVAVDQEHGNQLWRSDGTRAGTYSLLAHQESEPTNLAELRGKLYFRGPGTRAGRAALWTSDGTPQGTRLVKDVPPDAMLSIGSALVFVGPGPGGRGVSLWRSDGTAKGTVRISTIVSNPADLTLLETRALAGRYYFTAGIKNQGDELWASDGTSAGTRRLTNFAKESAFQDQDGIYLLLPTLTAGSRVVFAADDGVHGAEPWVTDGTPAGTRLLRDLCPGPCKSLPFPAATIGSRLILNASTTAHGREPWVTDGTPVGTRILRDICAGACPSSPYGMVKLGGGLIFGANDGRYGFQLWKTDGTPRGTTRLTTFPAEVSSVARIGAAIPGAVLYSANSQRHGLELWRTDGTVAGTVMVVDPFDRDIGGGRPRDLLALGDRLLFLANDGIHGRELWTSDGTEEGTRLVLDTPPYPTGTDRTDFTRWVTAGGVAYLMGTTSEGRGIWRTNGTEEGTYRLVSAGSRPASGDEWIVAAGDRVFFYFDAEHWTSDGTVQGTRVLDLNPEGPRPNHPVAFGDNLYIGDHSGIYSVWRSDGTPEGTVPVPFLTSAKLLGEHAGRLWFNRYGSSGTQDLWSTDGTEAGTTLLLEDFTVGGLISAGSRMFLMANGGLWISDGTGAGTRRVSPHHTLAGTAILDGKLFYTYDRELWVSDGTEAGTQLVLNAEGEGFEGIRNLVRFADRIWFIHGGKIWRTDGTNGGTIEVAPVNAQDPELVPAGNRLYYPYWTPEIGYELWAIAP